MRGKFEKFKKSIESHCDDGQNKVYQILNCLQQMHQIRLVEKIARPIPYEQKETYFQSFKQKFLQLHFLLQNLQRDIPKESESGNERHKGGTSTLGVRQKIKRQDIRKIQSAYKEVLIQSSFKYFYLVGKIQGLPLNINGWPIVWNSHPSNPAVDFYIFRFVKGQICNEKCQRRVVFSNRQRNISQ